ncbi:MAG: hypothetical protein WCP35_12895 [Verrucomicrobiota bacterium]
MKPLLTTDIRPFWYFRKLVHGIVGLLSVLVLPAAAVPIAAWDFYGESTLATSIAEVFDAKLDSANTVTRGSTAAASSGDNSFRTLGFKNNGIAIANSDYFQVTLSAATGYTLSLATLDANFNGTPSFYASPGVIGQFAYSLDGSTFTLIGNPFVMTTLGAMPKIDLTANAALQNLSDVTTVTIRYLASGLTTTGGWGFYSSALGHYGLVVGGTLADSNLPRLTLSADHTSFGENAATPAATGTVSIPIALASDLVVTLVSSDLTEAGVPATVTIRAGNTSANFSITAVNDILADGSQSVNLTASAIGYNNAVQAISVTDDGDAPPSLSPGAIAFVGINADGKDDLAFVALVPLAASDTIFITHRVWNGMELGKGGEFGVGEGVITWSAPAAGVTAGTVVTLNNLGNTTRSASVGTLTSIGSFNLSVDGETVYAYQGSVASPTGFLAVIATQITDAITGTGLNASQIIQLTNNADVAAYSGSRSNQQNFTAYLVVLANTDNWVTEDGAYDQSNNSIAPDVPFDTTAFSLASAGGYDAWAATHVNHQAADADADGDGVPNGVEYFMGETGGAFTPPPVVVNNKISWRHDAAAVATYTVATSTDLIHWQSTTEGVNDHGTSIEYTLPQSAQRVFVRLEVTTMP